VTLTRIHPGIAALLAMIAALAVAFTWATAAQAAPIEATDIRVIDGDTIRVYRNQPNVRLVGFNAPETRRAVCEAERELGDKATRRVRDLIRAGNLDFEFVACSCRPGTEETPLAIMGGAAERSERAGVT
jgi:endonuclease YncB( thermonuclease family)